MISTCYCDCIWVDFIVCLKSFIVEVYIVWKWNNDNENTVSFDNVEKKAYRMNIMVKYLFLIEI